MAQEFTRELFEPHIGSNFTMKLENAGAAEFELKLESIKDLGSSARHIQFSMIFTGPQDGPLRQGIYRIQHRVLGDLDLFLVPVGKDQNGVQYEAIVNRSVSSADPSGVSY